MTTGEFETSAAPAPYSDRVTITCVCQSNVPAGFPDPNKVQLPIFCQNCGAEMPSINVLVANMMLIKSDLEDLGKSIGIFFTSIGIAARNHPSLMVQHLPFLLEQAAEVIKSASNSPATLHFCDAIEKVVRASARDAPSDGAN